MIKLTGIKIKNKLFRTVNSFKAKGMENNRKNKSNLFIGLIHYPVYDKNRRIVTTAVTNLDIHDIARTATVFDVTRYFIVMPLASQKAMIEQIARHWKEGHGTGYNPVRAQAFERLSVVESLEEAVAYIKDSSGDKVYTVATSARKNENALSFHEMRSLITGQPGNYFFLFGTGWGLTDEFIDACNYVLEPVEGKAGYNHLPVRAAAAIIMDRLTRKE